MWRLFIVLVYLYSGTTEVFSACPERVFHGDSNCDTDDLYVSPPAGTNVLLDTAGYENFPADWTNPSVFPSGSLCSRGVFLCPVSSADDCIVSPNVGVEDVSRFSTTVRLNDFCFPPAEECQKMKVCAHFSNNQVTCFNATSMVPHTISVPSGASEVQLRVCPYPVTGYCVDVVRVSAMYESCPCTVSGLVRYPERSIPETAEIYYASCAEHAYNLTSLAVSTDGCKDVVDGGIMCACGPGYVVSSDGTSCEACPKNQYKGVGDTECLQCPQNSRTDGEGSTNCTCISEYFKAASDPPSMSCSQLPDPPRDLSVPTAASRHFGLSWSCPSMHGRDDLVYKICYKVALSSDEPSCTTYTPQSCSVQYTISGLEPATTYEIVITSQDGITDQDPEGERDRTASIMVTTAEDFPGAPILKRLCSVVIWQPPVVTNGIIQRYNLKFVNSADVEQVFNYTSSDNFHLTTKTQQEDNVEVQIRACNSRFCGPWYPDPPEPIDCAPPTTCAPVPECVCESESTPESIITTEKPTTEEPTTQKSTTEATTTEPPTTEAPTTTEAPSTEAPTTLAPTTMKPSTRAPATTEARTTQAPLTTITSGVCAGFLDCGDDVYFELDSKGVTSVDGSNIGVNAAALHCHTTYRPCCKSPAVGQFMYPDRNEVGLKKDGEECYRNRDSNGFIKLNCIGTAPTGEYGCKLLNSAGQTCCKSISIN